MKTFKYKIDGKEYEVSVNIAEENLAEVEVNGTSYKIELEKKEEEAPAPKIQRPVASAAAATSSGAAGSKAIKSPLPGIVVAINVAVGDAVKKGQTVAILEAMKMENNIQAPADGKVASIGVNVGESVLEGVIILSLD